MSAHYSKWSLNTYSGTPYFRAHMPRNYPLELTLQKCRAYRRLPKRLQELCELSKRWAWRVYPHHGIGRITDWYDDDGYELNPSTGQRLTDEQIDADWPEPDERLRNLKVKDIPRPKGGFPDPDTWEEPKREEEPKEVDEGDMMTEEQLVKDIKSHGREYVLDYYSIAEDEVKDVESPEELATVILHMHNKPRPANLKP